MDSQLLFFAFFYTKFLKTNEFFQKYLEKISTSDTEDENFPAAAADREKNFLISQPPP
jgi:hypothetical protein